MATASFVLPDGTKVQVEGSPEEVARLLAAIPPGGKASAEQGRQTRHASPAGRKGTRVTENGLTSLLRELKVEGFFSERRRLPDIQKELEGKGRIYDQPPLSATLLHLVRKRELRRIKHEKNWAYIE